MGIELISTIYSHLTHSHMLDLKFYLFTNAHTHTHTHDAHTHVHTTKAKLTAVVQNKFL